MKAMTDSLKNFLLNSDTAYICDLYMIKLTNGEIICICSGDMDIVHDNNTYQHGKYIIKRNQVKTEGSPTVDTLTCTIYHDQDHSDIKVSGKSIFAAAYDGDFDDALVTVYKAYVDIDNNNTVMGVMDIFYGNCDTSSVSGISVQLTIKSNATGLNADYPPRIYAPQSAYYTNNSGNVVTSEKDKMTVMIPLKPQSRVLTRLAR